MPRVAVTPITTSTRATYLQEEPRPDGIANFEEIFGKEISFGKLKQVPVLLMVGAQDTEVMGHFLFAIATPANL